MSGRYISIQKSFTTSDEELNQDVRDSQYGLQSQLSQRTQSVGFQNIVPRGLKEGDSVNRLLNNAFDAAVCATKL